MLATDFNTLVDRISKDGEFFHKTLGGEHGVISKDAYTKKLLELYTDIYMNDNADGDDHGKPNFAKEAAVLGIQRSDYMLNPIDGNIENGYGLKQVELNTIAASFAGLSVNVASLHKMLTLRFDHELKVSELASCMSIVNQTSSIVNQTHDFNFPPFPFLMGLSCSPFNV